MKTPLSTTSQIKSLGWLGVVFAVHALTACSGGSTPSANAAGVNAAKADSASVKAGDPLANDASWRADAIANGIITARKACDLLTREDSEAAVGQPLPKKTENITLGTCDYTADDFSAGATVTVSSWESIKNAATTGPHQPTAIGGLGDEASNVVNSGDSILYVRRGDEGFALELNSRKIDALPDHGLAVEKDLALKIIGKF